MANIDNGFNVEILSLNDRTLITSGVGDPSIAGFEAPEGSLYLYKSGTNSTVFIKRGPLDTDWAPAGNTGGIYAALGANADITSLSAITGGIATPDYVDLDTTATVASAPGRVFWGDDNTVNIGLLNDVTLQVGQESHFYGKASGAISNGDVVMYVGAQGNHTLFAKADAASYNNNPSLIIGVATQPLADNQFGYVTCFGKVHDINTASYTEGSILYADPTVPGGLTPIKPVSPNAAVQVAAVIHSHASQGVLLVRPTTALSATDIIPTVLEFTKDGTGFPNRTDTTSTFDVGTRTYTLTPNNANACVYKYGTRYPITAPISYTIPDVSGSYFIKLDHTTMTFVTGSPNILGGDILVAYIMWNASSQQLVLFADERHSTQRDLQWHTSHHLEVGTTWRSGGAVSYTLNDEANTSIGIATPLSIADEDIVISISNTPSAEFGQTLSPAAVMPVLFLNGTAYDVMYPVGIQWPYQTGGRLQYNSIVGGVGSVVEVPDNSYVNYWIIAFLDFNEPVKVLMGQNVYTTTEHADAESFANYGLPMPEKAALYRVTLHTHDVHTNTGKCIVTKVVKSTTDLTGVATATAATSHDALINRDDPDQHPISAITGLQTALDSKQSTLVSGTNIKTVAGYSLVGAGNVPLALDDLSDVTINTPLDGQTLVYDATTGQWTNVGNTGGTNGGGAAKRIWSGNIGPSTGTSVITPSTTVPLVTAGTQLWTNTITPLSTSATYVVQSNIMVAGSNNGTFITLALFRNGVFVGGTLQVVQSSSNSATLSFSITDKPNSTTPVTYQCRVGINSNTWYVNRRNSEITYNGQINTGWVMWEY